MNHEGACSRTADFTTSKVQIPLLHGQINYKLDKVLSVFDQHLKDGQNRQILTLDEDMYTGDSDITYLIRHLLAAASDTKLRHDMNVEDEFFTAIENRDTAIMACDKKIKEQDSLISEQSNIITIQNDMLKKMVMGMLDRDMETEDIAMVIGMSVEDIRQM